MDKYLESAHCSTERAAITDCALGLHINIDHDAYGNSESIRVMFGSDVLFHGARSDGIAWLCGLHSKVNSVLSLIEADGVCIDDADLCIKSIGETCLPKRLTETYKKWVLGNKSLNRYLSRGTKQE